MTCAEKMRSPLFFWGYPVCRPCAARIQAQAPRDAQGRTICEPGCAHGLEHVPPTIDDLDIQLALHVIDAMLHSMEDMDAASAKTSEHDRQREALRDSA
jgi:hypothetical protein